MKKALLSIANGNNHNAILKSHKYHAYSSGFKHFNISEPSEIFSFWHKFDSLLVLNSHCIINYIDQNLLDMFHANSHKNMLISSIEHIPLCFDAFVAKTSNWSKIFLSDILRKRIYVDEYVSCYNANELNIKQIQIDETFRTFSGGPGHMIYNTIMEPSNRQIQKINSANSKLGII